MLTRTPSSIACLYCFFSANWVNWAHLEFNSVVLTPDAVVEVCPCPANTQKASTNVRWFFFFFDTAFLQI